MAWGPWQILIVALLVVVLFGSKKLPELARSIGKAKGEFKKGLLEGEKEEAAAEEAAKSEKLEEEKKEPEKLKA